ncbi:prepilin-type N-terminal cleavage/methylation domain-containing protein [Anaerococcus sp. Marseille-P3625]|uniref:prepilin-type N-terminal cleavage/methylation domain-containing protein n=1 Tax=Anaerococcus sp. Marseille-P3625 TaxID=1977277 RepID=UPI000C081B0D|nr:prepilin-type N-terminal cleavage/methylation domain-containing protein [Anaerococcus sp. Marseille-P3625]
MKKNGFTLIELLASLAIVSIIAIVITSIFSISFKSIDNSFEEEITYKESTFCMLYIENIVRSAYSLEIIEGNEENNLKAYVVSDSGEIISSKFRIKNREGTNYLEEYHDNLSNKSEKGAWIKIGICQNLYLNYNPNKKSVHIILNDDSASDRYESIIYVGDRL